MLTGTPMAGHGGSALGIVYRLGIELTKILVVQYSNQETSVTIGESVRDEDGKDFSSYSPSDAPWHSQYQPLCS